MITKKIGKVVFGWDPTAMNGKGYWYVWSPGDVLSRAASSEESQKLGKPKTTDLPKAGSDKKKYYYDVGTHGKPVRKQIYTGSEYEEAEITGRKSLMQLASERMMSGEGLGKSLSGAISSKFKARATRFKKLRDPMNWLSKMPGVGKLAATAYGKKFGRTNEDISYFTGVHAPPGQEEETETATKQSDDGESSKKETSTKVLKEIYKLLENKFETDKLNRDIDNNFKEEDRAEEDLKHKELIEAITKETYKFARKRNKISDVRSESSNVFGPILTALSSLFGGFIGKLASVFGIFGKIGGFASAAGRGVLSAGKSVVKGVSSFAGKATSTIGKGLSSVFSKGKSLISPAVKGGLDTTKSALLQAKPSTVTKIAEAAEKSGSALAKSAKTASKVAGAGSKLLKGGGKLLGFLKSVPGLGVMAAGADLIMRVNDVNSKLENGEITDADYKKEITKAIGDAAAAGLLPILGGALGSVIPGVGTLAGGLAGVGVSLLGGDKIGGWLAGKMYDYFMEDKKSSQTESSPTASPIQQVASIAPTNNQNISNIGSTTELSSQMKASPVGATPSPIATRAQNATNENNNLTGPTSTIKSQPVILNSPTTNVVNGKSGSGSSVSASVRNDDPILTRLQFQNVRPV